MIHSIGNIYKNPEYLKENLEWEVVKIKDGKNKGTKI